MNTSTGIIEPNAVSTLVNNTSKTPTTSLHFVSAYLGRRIGQDDAFNLARLLVTMIDGVVDESPFDIANKLTVLHDTPLTIPSYRGVTLHRLSLRTSWLLREFTGMPGNDARWLAYAHELVGAPHSEGLAQSNQATFELTDCVFAIDLADVRVISDPSSLCVSNPSTFFSASDVCYCASDQCTFKLTKRWLAATTRLNNFTASNGLRKWLLLGKEKHRSLWNCGIVGGSWSRLRHFLFAMRRGLEAHYRRLSQLRGLDTLPLTERFAGQVRMPTIDALVHNEVLLMHEFKRGRAVITGYPAGPLNLPMFGDLCHNCGEGKEFVPCSRGTPFMNELLLKLAPTYFFTLSTQALSAQLAAQKRPPRLRPQATSTAAYFSNIASAEASEASQAAARAADAAALAETRAGEMRAMAWFFS
mmetsp:Transcript_23674/g.39072  ORF Transcript_23674/g.39072 Transcript_23674/m.39072 type:complete len:416 (-) Transcript_23674:28-1275(-)